ncbi:MAG: hypothetical protein L0287_35395 [Anaerolineae bacterium]|nr:hypothetical protein [Anaerolineae bacterium]MCI0608791.1 hypothetical protein [Anaerolineae bacterium]
MKKKISILIGGLLVALMVIGVIGATNVFAQSSTLNTPEHGRGPGGGRGLGPAELEAAAEVLGMTVDELTTALQSGRTLAELATEAGVELQDVRDAIQEVREAALRERIAQAVADGTMSQEKADWLLEGLDKGFLDGPGFGFGFGPHGPRPDRAPTPQPTQSSSG